MKPSHSSLRAFNISLLLFVILVAFGCAQEAPAPAADVAEKAPTADDIPWFEGTVDEAFELAKAESRPVFLYWGAEWCPPCHALRSRLFARPEFQARLAATVPVYLDGDTARAQIWGEKLGTYGYPTVIIFNSEGEEVTRIPGTLPVDQYAEVLSAALDATRPISEVLAAAEADGPGGIPQAELNLLAFYSFGQDQTLNLDLAREREIFERFWRETPAEMEVEKARFLSLYLWALADEDDDVPAHDMTDEERAEILAGLQTMLNDPVLRNTNLDLVLYGASDCVPALAPEPGETRDALVAAWSDASTAIEEDKSLSIDDRLTALVPQLEMAILDVEPEAEGEDPPIPSELQDRIRERVQWAGDTVRDEDEMQAVMSTMAHLLEAAGLESEAETLLSEKMSETTAPYYYMGWLAGMKARSGHEEEAVELYREAWQGARASGTPSTMTAFRWGSSYLRQIMRYTPDSADSLATDAETIVGDLLSGPDAFAGGNWSRLKGLSVALEKWEEEDAALRTPLVDTIREQVQSACADFPDEGPESSGGRCVSFLMEDVG